MAPLQLPPELWAHIFSLLQPRDLVSVVLVCRHWAAIARLPAFWAKVRVNKRKLVKEGFHQFFSLPRYGRVRSLDYSRAWIGRQQWREILAQVVNCAEVEELDLSQARLDDVGPELVASALARVSAVRLCGVQGLDLPYLLRAVSAAPGSRLRHLVMEELCQLTNVTLHQMEPMELARTLSTLSSVELGEASLLTIEQLEALLDYSSHTGTKVGANLSTEEAMVSLPRLLPRLARATVQVGSSWHEAPWLWHTLLAALGHPRATLARLDLEAVSVSLAGVSGSLLAAGLARLRALRLSGLHLTPDQWSALLRALPHGPLSSLSLRMVGLTGVPTDLLVAGLQRLSSLTLQFAALSPAQWRALLPCLAQSASLRCLALGQVDLSWLPPDLLPPLARRLHSLDLSDSRLPAAALEALLTSLPGAGLRFLGLSGLDCRQVPREGLARGLVAIHRVGLRKARLGEEQLRALLTCSLGPSRLRRLDLSGVNLSSVPGDILALAVSRLQEADLACTWLTRAQLHLLVEQVCRFTRLEHLRLQAATVALLSREMRQRLEGEMYLSVF